MQANLSVQSESGAHWGDTWGYDIDDNPGVEPIGTVHYEDDEENSNQNPLVYFSGEEESEEVLDNNFDLFWFIFHIIQTILEQSNMMWRNLHLFHKLI